MSLRACLIALLLLAGCAARPLVAKTADLFEDRLHVVTVDADRMERFVHVSNMVVFSGNVVARQNESIQYADRMEVYLDAKGDRIVRAVSTGNVRILTRDCQTATAQRAEYYEQQVVLSDNVRVSQKDRVVSSERVAIDLSKVRWVTPTPRWAD